MSKSNYDITRDRVESEFIKYDQEPMIEKFHLKHDEQYLYLTFIGREYRINRVTGRVEWSEDNFTTPVHGGFNETLSIFDALCYSKANCHLSGNFCMVNNLKGTVYSNTLGNDLFRKPAQYFDARMNLLTQACEKLGGIPQKVGDVSYLLYPFEFMPVMLQFWQADDEFPATLKLMWDENILDYIRYETTYYVAGHLMDRLMEIIEQLAS